VIAFVTNIVERWLVEISHASGFARSILSMPGLRHSTKAVWPAWLPGGFREARKGMKPELSVAID